MILAEQKYQTIRIEQVGDVVRIVFDHPDSKLNAIDGLMHEEITRLFRELKQEDRARAALITGEGQMFSAGGNFNWFPEVQNPEPREQLRRDARQMIWDLLDVEIPIVTAVNGPAVGLAASLVLLSDVIFMADNAIIADPHVRAGIAAGDGGVATWPLILGPPRAKEYLLTGDPVDAATAERIGLVNHVVPADQLQEKALEFATRLAKGAPLAIRFTKQSVNALIKDALNVAFDTSTALEMITFQSEDHLEAMAAIREKRDPIFKGR